MGAWLVNRHALAGQPLAVQDTATRSLAWGTVQLLSTKQLTEAVRQEQTQARSVPQASMHDAELQVVTCWVFPHCTAWSVLHTEASAAVHPVARHTLARLLAVTSAVHPAVNPHAAPC